MHLLRATIDPVLLYEKISELLALADNPERLAEKLNMPHEVEKIQSGINAVSFKRLVIEVEKLLGFVKLEKEIANVQSGKWSFSFMGKSFTENKLAVLMEKRRKFGSLIETPRWFYRQDRVWLLNAFRDYALDGAHQGDAEWVDEPTESLPLPITAMLETGNVETAKMISTQLSKPLANVEPDFIINCLEGHRALHFDLAKKAAYYFAAVKES